MPNRRTRDRQLAKLAARRAAERRRRRMRRLTVIGVAVAVAVAGVGYGGFVLFVGTGKKSNPRATAPPSPSATPSAAAAVACGGAVPKAASRKKPSFSAAPKVRIDPKKTYTVTMETSCGTIAIRLDQKDAPYTVNSLVFLIEHRFFDGLTFHRIAKGFVIQGGDPRGDGTGGPGYTTVDPPPANAQYPVGTVAMAKTQTEPDGTAGSQFFIVTSASAQAALAPGGKGQYAIVGHVVAGMDVVNRIAALPIEGGGQDGPPAQKVYMVGVRVKAS